MADDYLVVTLGFNWKVLRRILTFLPPKDLIRCRAVCLKWQRLINTMLNDGELWCKHCRRDYLDVYDTARRKSKSSLSWYQLYRSLTLWPKLKSSVQIRHELALVDDPEDEINNFQLLRDGIIGVHRKYAIVYYDLNTLQESKRDKIVGMFIEYRENDNVILVHDRYLRLSVTWKVKEDFNTGPAVILTDVRLFLLVGDVIYYVTINNEIYVCKLVNRRITKALLKQMQEDILLLGYKNDALIIFTSSRYIFTLVGDELTCVLYLININKETVSSELKMLNLPVFKSFNLLNEIEWKLLFPCTVSRKPCSDGVCLMSNHVLTALFSYGSVIFTGSNNGDVGIYYLPDLPDDLEKQRKPKSQIYDHTLEVHDCSKPTKCAIIRIDVVEGYDSHTVILGLLNKIVLIKFIHRF